jgi:DNA-binding MarR family transcriptional regulator
VSYVTSDRLIPLGLRKRDSFVLIRLATPLRQECVDALGTVGLSMHQHAILLTLEEFGSAAQKEVAARLSVDSGDLVSYLDGLQEAGLIRRDRDQRDRRRQILAITPAGRRLLTRAETALNDRHKGILRALSAAERHELVRLATIALTAHAPEIWSES